MSLEVKVGGERAFHEVAPCAPPRGSCGLDRTYTFEPGDYAPGNLTSATDGERHETAFTYDDFGRRIGELAPGSRAGPGAQQIEPERTAYA